MAGETELLMGPAVVGVILLPAIDIGGDSDDELDKAVGEISGEVLILIWMLFGVAGVVVEMVVGKKRADGEVISRGSRSTSHFLLPNGRGIIFHNKSQTESESHTANINVHGHKHIKLVAASEPQD